MYTSTVAHTCVGFYFTRIFFHGLAGNHKYGENFGRLNSLPFYNNSKPTENYPCEFYWVFTTVLVPPCLRYLVIPVIKMLHPLSGNKYNPLTALLRTLGELINVKLNDVYQNWFNDSKH